MGREAGNKRIEEAKLNLAMKETLPKIQEAVNSLCAGTKTQLAAQIAPVGKPLVILQRQVESKKTFKEKIGLGNKEKRDKEYLQSVWTLLQGIWDNHGVHIYAQITPGGAEMKLAFKNPEEAIKKYEQEHTQGKVWVPPNMGKIETPQTVVQEQAK